MAEEAQGENSRPPVLPIINFHELNEEAIKDMMMNHLSYTFNQFSNVSGAENESTNDELVDDDYQFLQVLESQDTDDIKNPILEQLKLIVDKLNDLNNANLNQYFMRALKIEMLYIGANDLFYNSSQLFVILGEMNYDSISLNGCQPIKHCIRDAYVATLAKYITGIGTERFCTHVPDDLQSKFDGFISRALRHFFGQDKPHLPKTFNQCLYENHFLNTENEDPENPTPGIENFTQFDFDDDEKFNFDEFSKIFLKLTGKSNSTPNNDYFYFLEHVVQATEQTHLNFFKTLVSSPSTIQTPIFVSSQPHAYEKMLIDQFATYSHYTKQIKVPKTINDFEDDEDVQTDQNGYVVNDNGEIQYKNSNEQYIQLYSYDGRKNEFPAINPPTRNCDLPFLILSDYKSSGSKYPNDFKIRGTCEYPFFHDPTNRDTTDNVIVNSDIQNYLRYGTNMQIMDGLGPVEQQLLRLIELFSLKQSIFNDNKQIKNFPKAETDNDDEYPNRENMLIEMNSCIASIAYFLFPSIQLSYSQDAAKLFTMSVLAELYKLLKYSKINDNTPEQFVDFNAGDIRRVFRLAMEGIIPAVYEHLPQLAMMSQTNQPNISFEQNENECLIHPPSFRLYLRQLLFNPTSRKECPVLYSYMVNKEKFVLIKHIPKIAPMIYRLWDLHEQYNLDNIDNLTFEDIGIPKEELAPFLQEWTIVANMCLTDTLSMPLRQKIKMSIPESEDAEPSEVKIRPYLPYDPKEWPALHILEFLSEGHNEFIRTLQKYSRLNVIEIDDKLIPPAFNYMIDCNNFDYYILRCVRHKMQANCLPVFDKESEADFVKSLSQLTYCLIMHPFISCSGKSATLITSQNLVSQFEEQIGLISINSEQRLQLSTYVKQENKDTGLKLLLNKFMFHLIDATKFPLQAPLSVLFDIFNSTNLSALEQDGASVLRVVQGKLDEPFKIGHIPSIYLFLQEPIDQSAQAESLQAVVIKNAIIHFGISKTDIDKISLHSNQVDNFRPWFTFIPKVVGALIDVVKHDEVTDFKKLKPSAVIQEFKQLDLQKRLLLDQEEEKAIEMISNWEKDDPTNGWNMSTLFSFFYDAQDNFK